MENKRAQTQQIDPLVIDVEGALVLSDLTLEAVLHFARLHPGSLWRLPLWWLRGGRQNLAKELFARVSFDPKHLPYNESIVTSMRQASDAGRRIIFMSSLPSVVAETINQHFGRMAHVVPKSEVSSGAVLQVYAKHENRWRSLPKAIRMHQWAKNLLVFCPLAMAHKLNDVSLMLTAALAFVAFCLISSSVYIVNDMMDLDSDRMHPHNRRRPFASGNLPLSVGFALVPVLLLSGAAIAWFISPKFLGVILGYFVVTSAYTFHLKGIVLADVLILAFLYALRAFAGAVAVDIVLSSWFLAFAVFFFFSLALLKRCSELVLMEKAGKGDNPRRGYSISDLTQIASFGTASGYMSVLVLALYINSEQVRNLYKDPEMLWLICPVLLYWISRMWLKAHRGKMHTDPLVFAMKDRSSYFILTVTAVIWLLASY